MFFSVIWSLARPLKIHALINNICCSVCLHPASKYYRFYLSRDRKFIIGCRPQLDLLIEKCFGDLQFLSDEFSKLEVMVSPSELDGGESSFAGRNERDPSLDLTR